jgi:hypothetical protein
MDNRDLIRQYVDTGLEISEYQFNQLSNNDKKTYMRKRIIAHNNNRHLSYWEFHLLDEQMQIKLLVDDVDKQNLFLKVLLSKFSKDRVDGINKINYIFDLYFKRYKNIGIPDSVFSFIMGHIEDDAHIITKLTSKEYLQFLTPSAISSIIVSDNMVNKNGFIKYLLNNKDLREKLKPMNFIYFILFTTDKRIVDEIMTDLFLSYHYEQIITGLSNAKLKLYIAEKIQKIDDEYRDEEAYEMGGFIEKKYREYLDNIIDKEINPYNYNYDN